MRVKRIVSWLFVALIVGEVLLVLVSWLLSATMKGGVRSLLSSEGVRWFFGSFTDMVASPWLVWLLVVAMAGGCLWRSGLLHRSQSGYRERMAFRTALAFLVLYVGVILMLTIVPHAVLLSATGQLFPSPFSRALVPILSFGLLLLSTVYGWASGRFTTFSDVIDSMAYGISQVAPLFVLYILLVQFCDSLRFVFL